MNRRQFFVTIGIPALVLLFVKEKQWKSFSEYIKAIHDHDKYGIMDHRLQPLSLKEALLADEDYHLELALRKEFAEQYAEIWIAEERNLFKKFWHGDGKIKYRMGRVKS